MAGGSVALGVASAQLPSGEPTLDRLFAEPIVRQLMHRDRTDEATIRHLLQEIAPLILVEPIAQRLIRRDLADEVTIRHPLQETAAARPALPGRNDLNTDDRYPMVWLLHETARLWRNRYDREVGARLPGMTRARCAVLIYLAQHEAVNQAALAQMLDIRSSTLVRLLDGLEAGGFVARMPDPDDSRAHVLALTAKALPIIEYIYNLTRKIDGDLQFGISKTEAGQLRSFLRRIRSNPRGRLGQIPSSEPTGPRGDA